MRDAEEASEQSAAPAAQPAGAPAHYKGAARAVLMAAAAAVLTCGAGLWAYHAAFYAPPLRIATVDLDAVVEAKQLQFAEAIGRPGITDAEREGALKLVEGFASELGKAVSELKSECECLVLVKAAVVGASGMDLTPQLKQKMQVSNVDVEALRARIRGMRAAGQNEGRGSGGPK